MYPDRKAKTLADKLGPDAGLAQYSEYEKGSPTECDALLGEVHASFNQ
jgi:hypothetical protein